MSLLRKVLKLLLRPLGFSVVKTRNGYPIDFEDWTIEIINRVQPFTMTSPERINGLCHAVKYILGNNISGEIVECGVWKGGSMMAAALAAINEGNTEKTLYLFDTFEGMVKPSEDDINLFGKSALKRFKETATDNGSVWDREPQDSVMTALYSTGYPKNNLVFVKGRVEDTIPENAPNQISLLRLDTDWYESTKHEMEQLFPRLSKGGILIIDDYGHWMGARKAIDEYLKKHSVKMFLSRIDYTGRIGIKL